MQVTVESAESIPSFVVGVGRKPLANTNIETSDEIWAISNKGFIYHAGEADRSMTFNLAPGDSLELQYNANSADGTLLCDYGTGYVVVHGIGKREGPVYPVFLFPQDESVDPNSVQVRFHSIAHICSSSFSDFRGREQHASGSPHLSPASSTLAQAVVSLLHQLQDKEPWNRAIGQVRQGAFWLGNQCCYPLPTVLLTATGAFGHDDLYLGTIIKFVGDWQSSV